MVQPHVASDCNLTPNISAVSWAVNGSGGLGTDLLGAGHCLCTLVPITL